MAIWAGVASASPPALAAGPVFAAAERAQISRVTFLCAIPAHYYILKPAFGASPRASAWIPLASGDVEAICQTAFEQFRSHPVTQGWAAEMARLDLTQNYVYEYGRGGVTSNDEVIDVGVDETLDNKARELAAQADGVFVFAPGWAQASVGLTSYTTTSYTYGTQSAMFGLTAARVEGALTEQYPLQINLPPRLGGFYSARFGGVKIDLELENIMACLDLAHPSVALDGGLTSLMGAALSSGGIKAKKCPDDFRGKDLTLFAARSGNSLVFENDSYSRLIENIKSVQGKRMTMALDFFAKEPRAEPWK